VRYEVPSDDRETYLVVTVYCAINHRGGVEGDSLGEGKYGKVQSVARLTRLKHQPPRVPEQT
jgi:hypothetical protein